MDTELGPVRLNVGPQGRIVIPAELRRAWGLEQGETLVARLKNGQLVLQRPLDALREFLDKHPQLREGPSMAEELIQERRAEAVRDNAEMGL